MNNNDYKTNLKSVYNTIADHFSKTRSFLWPEFNAFIPLIKAGAHVIDIGCGNGRLIELLQTKNCTYLGIDQAEDLLQAAQHKWPHYTFETADMSTYHYGRERFDIAFFIASLHHLDSFSDQLKVLLRVHTALKHSGYVFITVWNIWQAKYKKFIQKTPYHHSYIPYTKGSMQGALTKQRFYYAFTKTELMKVCKQAGFKMIDCWYSNKDQRSNKQEARNICFIGQKI